MRDSKTLVPLTPLTLQMEVKTCSNSVFCLPKYFFYFLNGHCQRSFPPKHSCFISKWGVKSPLKNTFWTAYVTIENILSLKRYAPWIHWLPLWPRVKVKCRVVFDHENLKQVAKKTYSKMSPTAQAKWNAIQSLSIYTLP